MASHVRLVRPGAFAIGLTAALLGFPACGGAKPTPPAGGSSASAEGPLVIETTPKGTTAGGSASPAFAGTAPLTVVAQVDGIGILAKEVEDLAASYKAKLRAQGRQMPEGADLALRRSALDSLIARQLVLEAARKAGTRVDPKNVDTEYAKRRSRFASEEEFKRFLEESGSTEAGLKAQTERELLMEAYMGSSLPKPVVSESMARKFYDQHKEEFKQPETARVGFILVASRESDPPAKREESRKRIEEAQRRAVGGEDFAALAKRYSDMTMAGGGRDTGLVPRGRLSPAFDKAAFGTPIGQVSSVFEIPKGFAVIKAIERRGPRLQAFDEIKAHLIQELIHEAERQATARIVGRLRSAAVVKILEPELTSPSEPAVTGAGPSGSVPQPSNPGGL